MKLRWEERALWLVSYAVAYTTRYIGAQPGAKRVVLCVNSIEIADSAVRELRDRRATGQPDAGRWVG